MFAPSGSILGSGVPAERYRAGVPEQVPIVTEAVGVDGCPDGR